MIDTTAVEAQRAATEAAAQIRARISRRGRFRRFLGTAARNAGWAFLCMTIMGLMIGVGMPLGIHWIEAVTDFWSKIP